MSIGEYGFAVHEICITPYKGVVGNTPKIERISTYELKPRDEV
jgi:hypothetical protein